VEGDGRAASVTLLAESICARARMGGHEGGNMSQLLDAVSARTRNRELRGYFSRSCCHTFRKHSLARSSSMGAERAFNLTGAHGSQMMSGKTYLRIRRQSDGLELLRSCTSVNCGNRGGGCPSSATVRLSRKWEAVSGKWSLEG
jgi:hypothetical protein